MLWETDDEEARTRILRDLSPDHIGPRFVRIRDQVMALVAWHAALRSSEYRALRASDLERTEDGYLVTVRRSKTDQFGNGELKSLVPAKDPVLCPVRALDRWLALTGLEGEDFLFPTIFRGTAISDRGFNSRQAVNFNLRRLGEDASVPGLTGHSFRTGFGATSRQQGKSTEETMTTTGHRDYDTATIYERSAPMGADPLRGLVA
ncbi:tyrosine-type recombinase/integrase [Dermacoccus sp. 147Ba]|uniref:tyrosine-type recombinase/integrase n=1 Tax=Dermacoccus sp. 147Ba TaxID=2510111 RepID=UPI0013EAC2F6|nr:tyrosine-type recombinase/integrase [Dermacoccus sp. 147Ba]